MSATDVLSVLHSHSSHPLAKTWLADSTIKAYSKAKDFKLKQVPVAGIRALSGLLTQLEGVPTACIIRGGYVGNALAKERTPATEYIQGHVLRRNTLFDDQPLHTILIEVDDFEPTSSDLCSTPSCIEEYIMMCLPESS
jgi:putative DNA primase/helicase